MNLVEKYGLLTDLYNLYMYIYLTFTEKLCLSEEFCIMLELAMQ